MQFRGDQFATRRLATARRSFPRRPAFGKRGIEPGDSGAGAAAGRRPAARNRQELADDPGAAPPQRPSPAVWVARLCLVTALFVLFAWGALALTRDGAGIPALWLANAVVLVIVLRERRGLACAVVVAAFLANVAVEVRLGSPAGRAAGLGLANCFEIILVGWALRRIGLPRPDMANQRQLLRFVAVVGLAAMVSAALKTAVLMPAGFGTALPMWWSWLRTEALGLWLGAPCLILMTDAWRARHRPSRRRLIEIVATTALCTVLAVLVFWQMQAPLMFLMAPIILLHSFRLGPTGAAFAIFTIAVIATIATGLGHGPILLTGGSLSDRLIVLQLFLASCLAMGLVVAAMDAARQRVEAALRRSEAHFRELAETLPIGVTAMDRNGNPIYANQAWQRLYGFTPGEDWRESRHQDHIHPEDREKVRRSWRVAIAAGLPVVTEMRLLRRDGSIAWIEAIGTPQRNHDGQVASYIAVSIDNTGHKALAEDLIAAQRQAEAAVYAKSSFLANMSHEIRTPMTGVLGFAELLRDSGLNREQLGHANLIVESGRAMMRVLNDILDLAKVEAGELKILAESVDPRHVLEGCVKLMSVNAEQKQLPLMLAIDNSVPARIRSDPLRLRQVVLNLIGNALKFTDSGSVTVRAWASPLGSGRVTLAIAIEDTGIGIAHDRQLAIFRPFEQAENSTARSFGGTGLGLTISRQLITLMGGDLTMTSEPGAGSTFVITLPATIIAPPAGAGAKRGHRRAAPAPVGRAQIRAGTGAAAKHERRILLAEDHDINQILVSQLLGRLGYNVDLAVNGADAIACVERAARLGSPFDLVLMDIHMPEVDGYEATRRLRASGFSADDLPIVALTANVFAENVSACHEAGMQDHIAKPIIAPELSATLDKWLQRRRAAVPASDGDTIAAVIPPGVRDNYLKQRDDTCQLIREFLKNQHFDDDKFQAILARLHKLAGSAAYFGDGDFGNLAKEIQNDARQWAIGKRDRPAAAALGAVLAACREEHSAVD